LLSERGKKNLNENNTKSEIAHINVSHNYMEKNKFYGEKWM
jgi:hypothetical protein